MWATQEMGVCTTTHLSKQRCGQINPKVENACCLPLRSYFDRISPNWHQKSVARVLPRGELGSVDGPSLIFLARPLFLWEAVPLGVQRSSQPGNLHLN